MSTITNSDEQDSNELNKLLTALFTDQINQQDVDCLLKTQGQTLGRLEKSNEGLKNIVNLSASVFPEAQKDFNSHTQVLQNMKKDLEYIFKKLKSVKTKLEKKYPIQFAEATTKVRSELKDLDDEEDDSAPEAPKEASAPIESTQSAPNDNIENIEKIERE